MHTTIHTTCFSEPPEWFWQESPKWIVQVPHQIPWSSVIWCKITEFEAHAGPVSSEREEVEFPLINGSGGFNLSMAVPTEVHHSKGDVYVRVSRCCHTERHAILDPDDEYFRMRHQVVTAEWKYSTLPLPRICQASGDKGDTNFMRTPAQGELNTGRNRL